MWRLPVWMALGLALALVPAATLAGGGTDPVTVLTANVGNTKPACAGYLFNLCYAAVEERLRTAIDAHRPDVVALQEVPTVEQCHGMQELDPQKRCWQWQQRSPLHPVRGLVGPTYTIACDARHHFECIAVHAEAGTIQGCPTGQLCRDRLETLDVPTGCDDGFSVSAATVTLGTRTVRLVNAHPPSTNATCRAGQVHGLFTELATGDQNLVLGDLNLDPYHANDASVTTWANWVGPERPFAYHSGLVEHDPPHPTQFTWELANLYPTEALTANVVLRDPGPAARAAGQQLNPVLDHVVSDAFDGTCQTLG